jgi:hypothetical protein
MDMKHFFSVSVEIAAPPGHVWSVMAEVERWNLWTPSVTKIKRLNKGPFAVGSRLLIHQPKFPPALWRVTALEPDRGFTSVSYAPGMLVTAHHFIEPLPSGGSRVTLSIQYTGLFASIFSRLTARITERYLGFEATGLKKQCETTYVP